MIFNQISCSLNLGISVLFNEDSKSLAEHDAGMHIAQYILWRSMRTGSFFNYEKKRVVSTLSSYKQIFEKSTGKHSFPPILSTDIAECSTLFQLYETSEKCIICTYPDQCLPNRSFMIHVSKIIR